MAFSDLWIGFVFRALSENPTKWRIGGDLSFWFLPDVSEPERARADHSLAPANSRLGEWLTVPWTAMNGFFTIRAANPRHSIY